ncbi:MAG TPA: hypothetical protein VME45_07265 [Stellaceae bacterium]|nr:hypothetical protein [Stellaceae bacterium]
MLLDAGLQRTAAWGRANSGHVEWVRPDAGAICCITASAVRLRLGECRPLLRDLGGKERPGGQRRMVWRGSPRLQAGFRLLSMADLGDALAALTKALNEAATREGRS